MILKNVFINKFRGFSDVNLPLGENITVKFKESIGYLNSPVLL